MSIANTLEILASVPMLLKLKKGFAYRPPEEKDSLLLKVEENCERFAGRTAVVFEGQEISWEEVGKSANRIGNTLKAEGIEPGDVVSLIVENRPEFVFAVLGIMKIGATVALINTNLREEPLRHCITLINSKICVFGTEVADAIDGVRNQLELEAGSGFLAIQDGDDPIPEWARDLGVLSHNQDDTNPPETKDITIGSTAMYIFTSGTTGLPKAAVQSHKRIQQAATLCHTAGLRCTEEDRIYLSLPLYHGTGLIIGLGSALSSGASVLLRRRFSASNLVSDLKENNVTCMVYVGELCRYLVNLEPTGNEADTPLHTAIGNGLRPDIWDEFKQRYGLKRITELYAASEGNVSFANIFNKDHTIGMTTAQIALVQYDVLNDEIVKNKDGFCVEVPDGEPGLCIGHINPNAQFEGYTNKEATEKKILRNVFEEGDAWFNTGDLLRTVPVGFSLGYAHYQFVDRVGDTFRWRSENVSTNEVAEILNGFEQIDISNVYGVSVPATEGRAGMATVVMTNPNDALDLEKLSEYVCANLPHYGRPVFIRVQSEANITGTMKLVKTDLREEAYDLSKITDPVYIMKPRTEHYEPLDEAFLGEIQGGTAGY